MKNPSILRDETILFTLFVVLGLLFLWRWTPTAHGDPSTSTYYPFNGAASGTATSGTTITLGRMGSVSTYQLTLSSGTAPYTCQLVLSDSGIHPGDLYFIAVSYPGSGYPILNILDSATNGTLLHSSTDTTTAGPTVIRFVNQTGTQWAINKEGALLMHNLGAGVQAAASAPLNSGSGFTTGAGPAGSLAAGSTTIAPGPVSEGQWGLGLVNQTFISEGDSISALMNGASYESYAALLFGVTSAQLSGAAPGTNNGVTGLSTGTAAYSFFNHGTFYSSAQGGAVISNDGTSAYPTGAPAGMPQTATASWSGAVTSVNLTSGSATQPAGVMAVTGTNIPFGATGTLTNSGTTVQLSQATAGSSGGSVTIHLGGNNIMDRLPSQVYPHRPASFGGNGGARVLFLMMAGANSLRCGESAANIESDILAVTGTVEQWGMIPVVSTILPETEIFWSAAEEPVREQVNDWITAGNIPGAIWINSALALSGGTANFDGNGVHPVGQANTILANFWNQSLLHQGCDGPAIPEQVGTWRYFNQPISILGGIQYSGSYGGSSGFYNDGNWFTISQPLMSGTQYSAIYGGIQPSGYGEWSLGYEDFAGYGDPHNLTWLAIINADGIVLNGYGNASIGLSAAQAYSGIPETSNTNGSIVTGTLNATGGYSQRLIISTGAGQDFQSLVTTDSHSSGGNINDVALFPSLLNGQGDEAWWIGTSFSANNSAGPQFYNAGSGSTENFYGIQWYGANSLFNYFASGDLVIGGTNDNGNGFELETGTAKFDHNVVVGGTLSGGNIVATSGSAGQSGTAYTLAAPATTGTYSGMTVGTSSTAASLANTSGTFTLLNPANDSGCYFAGVASVTQVGTTSTTMTWTSLPTGSGTAVTLTGTGSSCPAFNSSYSFGNGSIVFSGSNLLSGTTRGFNPGDTVVAVYAPTNDSGYQTLCCGVGGMSIWPAQGGGNVGMGVSGGSQVNTSLTLSINNLNVIEASSYNVSNDVWIDFIVNGIPVETLNYNGIGQQTTMEIGADRSTPADFLSGNLVALYLIHGQRTPQWFAGVSAWLSQQFGTHF
jgi:hypothetical protein